MSDNPKAALEALTAPYKMTLGKMALLCRMDAPVLKGDVADICDTLAAVYILEHPLADSLAAFDDIRRAALTAYECLAPADYRSKVARMLDEVAAFIEMLPRPAPDAKKNSATDGSRS